MRTKLLTVLLLFLGIVCLKAQSTSDDSFSEKEIKIFSEIYEYKMNNPFDIVSAMKKNAAKIDISEQRMGEILKAQFAGDAITVSDSEKVELNKFQLLMEQDASVYRIKLNAMMKKRNLLPSQYEQIEKAFHSNNALRERVRKQAVKH